MRQNSHIKVIIHRKNIVDVKKMIMIAESKCGYLLLGQRHSFHTNLRAGFCSLPSLAVCQKYADTAARRCLVDRFRMVYL